MRDERVRAAEFLDVERFPQMRYRISATSPGHTPGRYVVEGELTLHGATRPVALEVVWHGESHDMTGHPRLGFTATATIDRTDWGVTWNAPIPGGELLPNRVDLLLEVSAVPEGTNARMMAAMERRPD